MGRIVIAGGGWAGCAAAIRAKKLGHDVTLIEKTDLLLGLGNALFHVGGGVDVIRDGGKCEKLGIFVAPGAMGLYLGGLIAGKAPWLLFPAGAVMALAVMILRSSVASCCKGMRRAESTSPERIKSSSQ